MHSILFLQLNVLYVTDELSLRWQAIFISCMQSTRKLPYILTRPKTTLNPRHDFTLFKECSHARTIQYRPLKHHRIDGVDFCVII